MLWKFYSHILFVKKVKYIWLFVKLTNISPYRAFLPALHERKTSSNRLLTIEKFRSQLHSEQLLSQIFIHLNAVCQGCKIRRLYLCRGVNPAHPTKSLVGRNTWGQDPGGWAVIDPATEVVTWPVKFHFCAYRARKDVGEAWPDQPAGYIKP